MNARNLLLIAAVLLVAGGCQLISAQWSLSVPFAVNKQFANGVIKETLNLPDLDETWADHADEINDIEKVEFDAIVVNALGTQDTIDMYVSATSTYTSRAQVQGAADAYPLLLGYVVPVGTDTLTIAESQAYLQLSGDNFTHVKELVHTGNFTGYITSSGDASVGQIDTANVYITFTGGD
jgi:ABC-type Na+ efflux pump permease subunit